MKISRSGTQYKINRNVEASIPFVGEPVRFAYKFALSPRIIGPFASCMWTEFLVVVVTLPPKDKTIFVIL